MATTANRNSSRGGGRRVSASALGLDDKTRPDETFKKRAGVVGCCVRRDVVLGTDDLNDFRHGAGAIAQIPDATAYVVECEILPALNVEEDCLALDLLDHDAVPSTEDAALI
jgi:hypothetical protein